MAAPIDFGFFDRPTVRGQKEAISLGTFGSLLGFAPGGKGTLSGFELQFCRIHLTKDSTKYSAGEYYFQF